MPQILHGIRGDQFYSREIIEQDEKTYFQYQYIRYPTYNDCSCTIAETWEVYGILSAEISEIIPALTKIP